MADDVEPLADYLDGLIREKYIEVRRGVDYVSHSPLGSDVVDYIEDESTGRPHPIDDGADHQLLRMFDVTRRELGKSLPGASPFNGSALIGASRSKWEGDSIAGVIAWCALHSDPEWPCVECSHSPGFHIDLGGGWSVCEFGKYYTGPGVACYPCNCGNNTGR